MTNSLSLGGDGQANHTLAVFRDGIAEGPLQNHVKFLPGLELVSDPKLALTGQWRSPEARLLELEAQPRGAGEWLALHLSLPVQDLRYCGTLGFAARIVAPETNAARACLRSGTENGFQDCFFDKRLLFRPEESTHLDALSVPDIDHLSLQAPWRELILFLPHATAFRLSLIDLRVFVV